MSTEYDYHSPDFVLGGAVLAQLEDLAPAEARRVVLAALDHVDLQLEALGVPARPDPLAVYRYRRVGEAGIACIDCGASFPRSEGSVMRGHRRRCPVNSFDHHTPGVCTS